MIPGGPLDYGADHSAMIAHLAFSQFMEKDSGQPRSETECVLDVLDFANRESCMNIFDQAFFVEGLAQDANRACR
jgi:hypothetical protein